MNKELILKIIEPYLSNKRLKYETFNQLFSEKVNEDELEEIYNLIIDEGIIIQDSDDDNDEIIIDETFLQDDEDYIPDNYKKGMYVKDLSNENLCILIQNGEKWAEDYLCNKNWKLVHKIALRYRDAYGHRLDFQDLVQVGMIGMLKAAKRFDKRFDTVFSTYAVWWIRQSVIREIFDNGFSIRIPVHIHEKINRITAVEREIYMQYGELNYEKKVQLIAKKIGPSTNIQKVNEYLMYRDLYLKPTSLDVPVGESDDSVLADFIISEIETPNDYYQKKALKEEIDRTLSSVLSKREENIIRLRFGLNDGRIRTLEEIGKEYGVSRERIRQIEAKAMRRLSNPFVCKELKEYINLKGSKRKRNVK